MTPPVIRDGKLKSHMLFRDSVVAPLENVGDPSFDRALHMIAHECAHVEVTSSFDRAFPNTLLKKMPDNLHDGLRWQVILDCWDEFAATWIAAPFGRDPTSDYEEVFIDVLAAARIDANSRIKAYRTHHDINQVATEVYGVYGRLMKVAAYHLGNMYGRGMLLEALPRTHSALANHWFAEHFQTLDVRLRAISEMYDAWPNTHLFEAIGDLADKIVEEGGMRIIPHANGTLYVSVPLTAETMPD